MIVVSAAPGSMSFSFQTACRVSEGSSEATCKASPTRPGVPRGSGLWGQSQPATAPEPLLTRCIGWRERFDARPHR